MFPWRRKGRNPFDDFIDDMLPGGFDDEMRRIHDHMNKIIRDAFENTGNIDPSKIEPGKSYVYGFSVRTGPDGKPMMEEFGNIPGKAHQKGVETSDEREPLTDVIEGKEDVKVIAELPGVEKKDIKLEAGEDSLSIDVDTKERKYSKDLKLPCKIKPETTKANYNNGVLEVTIQRAEAKKEKKTKMVKID
ncbi:MAG: archaeal heat shock protein Hsp20 [Candidatus Altiarchaeota archaeon]